MKLRLTTLGFALCLAASYEHAVAQESPTIIVVEELRVHDSTIVLPPLSIIISEAVSLHQNSNAVLPLGLTVSESISVQDRVAIVLPYTLVLSESITTYDEVTTLLPLMVTVTENITANDVVNTLLPLTITVTESISINDNHRVVLPTSILVSEMIVVDDAAITVPGLLILVTETVTTNDSVTTSTVSVPKVAFSRPIAGRCELELLPGIRLQPSVTELEIAFSVPMKATGSGAADAGNIANYRLVRSQNLAVLLPSNCSDPLPVGASEQAMVMYGYVADDQTTVLRNPLATGFEPAYYRLLACSGGLQSADGLHLDGDADHVTGGDYAISFSIGSTNLLPNPNFSGSANHWTLTNGASFSEEDADLAILAGSVLLPTEPAPSSTGQCVEMTGPARLRLAASFRGTTANSVVQLGINYFENAGCTGGILRSDTAQHTADDLSWSDGQLSSTTAPGIQSAWISFQSQTGSNPVYVDRVYLIDRPDLIFKNGFENVLETITQSCGNQP